MPEQKVGLCRRIAYYLAEDPMPWPTLGDLMDALGARTGTAMGERVREGRKLHGFDVRCVDMGRDGKKVHVYFMPAAERERVRQTDGYREWKALQALERRAS